MLNHFLSVSTKFVFSIADRINIAPTSNSIKIKKVISSCYCRFNPKNKTLEQEVSYSHSTTKVHPFLTHPKFPLNANPITTRNAIAPITIPPAILGVSIVYTPPICIKGAAKMLLSPGTISFVITSNVPAAPAVNLNASFVLATVCIQSSPSSLPAKLSVSAV